MNISNTIHNERVILFLIIAHSIKHNHNYFIIENRLYFIAYN